MPITETPAKLWFETEEEIKEYDERMVANMELTSLDFYNENFAPVYNRLTKETFLEPSERAMSDYRRKVAPFKGNTEDFINRYYL